MCVPVPPGGLPDGEPAEGLGKIDAVLPHGEGDHISSALLTACGAGAQTIPELFLRADDQGGCPILVEWTSAHVVSALSLELNTATPDDLDEIIGPPDFLDRFLGNVHPGLPITPMTEMLLLFTG